MKVEIKFFATLRLHLRVASLSLDLNENTTVNELIDILVKHFNDEKVREYLIDENGIRKGTMILINGKNILHLNGLDTKIEEGVISIFPPAGGG
ncbi:hypothetical protein XO10_05715 [Marinitoga sp. 1135]|uniref:MoaD family protein n=1 Tax=Marinitoga piezophila (strain DSM 14283 / JCM 11233 / KA3) TaxID=443254 RepID=H2J861_MARPK|nr:MULTISPECIES: MoaD family protein [Marinitoga]AEX85552.1 MoaD family protein [Marinitoga piezophila KA3]NUU95767.1 hypothetical protein [Marinitoga sp. 1135]NUU97689.1 hypothetical protein [Marinitoga sp. 1138]